MATNIKNIMMIILALGALAACSPSTSDRSSRSNSGGIVGVTGSATTCSANQQTVTRLYDDNSSSLSFEQRVKGFLSANMDPQYFGTISGSASNAQTGVTVEGHLAYDANGTVNLATTSLHLTINDSYVGQLNTAGTAITAFQVNFTKATSGTMNLSTKQFTVLFKDSYGEITVTGTVNNSTVLGSISYQNTTSYNNGTVSAGSLGAFSIPTCGWIN